MIKTNRRQKKFFLLRHAAAYASYGFSSCTMQRRIPCVVFAAASCSGKFHTWFFFLRNAAYNSIHGFCCCTLQRYIPTVELLAAWHSKQLVAFGLCFT